MFTPTVHLPGLLAILDVRQDMRLFLPISETVITSYVSSCSAAKA